MDIRWDTILGHEKNIAHLRRLWQEQRMPHALLFCGANAWKAEKLEHVADIMEELK